jgi:predicted ATPase
MLFLAFTLWPLGEIRRAVARVADAEARIAGLAHVGTRAFGGMHAAMFELMRGDISRATRNAAELARLTREHELSLWRALGVFLEGLGAVESGSVGGGLEDMRRGVEVLRAQNFLWLDGLLKIGLAEAEARAGGVDRAVAILDEALATCERTGYRAFEAELHRVRGEMLLKRDPADSATAEEALQTAIAVAKRQATRTFGLRAALALAKLHQTTDRPAGAHAVLAPALKGFVSTPEMPEIAEAQALLEALDKMEEVKAAIAQRQRRLDLQASYGQALMWGKGFAAEETTAAFVRIGEFVGPAESSAARFAAYDAQSLRSFMRGEYSQAREVAETCLREAEAEGRATDAGDARRMLGLVCLYQGDLKAARSVLERAFCEYVPERDGEARLPARDVGAAAFLALTEWHLGEVERARQLIDYATRRADELGHVATVANALFFKTVLESRRDDVSATRLAANALLELSEEYGFKTYAELGPVYTNWARGRLLDADEGASGLRQALAAYVAQGNRADAPSFQGLLAELEARSRGPDSALSSIERGLATADETGEHFTDPYLHRLRGDIFLKRNPADPSPAEEAYRTAVTIAKQQGARSYELLASLALAKFYQLTARPAEACAVLGPVLQGFSPTPEMPEIAEAQGLMERSR